MAAPRRQGVLVERCRVLEESGCVSVCLNVCKMPTQDFFTKEVGLPLTMNPNYETFECQFCFGATPPPPEEGATTGASRCPSRGGQKRVGKVLGQGPSGGACTFDGRFGVPSCRWKLP